MRLFLPSFYSCFIAIVSGSPVDYDPNSFSEDIASDSDFQFERMNVAQTQTPTQSGTSMLVALSNEDPTIDAGIDNTKTDVDSSWDTSIGTNPNDQFGSTYIADGHQTSKQSNEEQRTQNARKSRVEACKGDPKVPKNQKYLCNIAGIDWRNPVFPFIGGKLIFELLKNLVREVKEIKEVAQEHIREDQEGEAQRRDDLAQRAIEEFLEKLKEAKARIGEWTTDPEAEDETPTDDKQVEEFKLYFKSLDQNWLQRRVESGLIGVGYAARGAELTEAAESIITVLEVAGPVLLL